MTNRQIAIFNGEKSYHGAPCYDCGYTQKDLESHCLKCLPSKKRARDLWRKYHLTEEQWDNMYIFQEGKCFSCELWYPWRSSRLCVDHDHETGVNRSLICHNCNLFEGKAVSSEQLRKAANYHDLVNSPDYIPPTWN